MSTSIPVGMRAWTARRFLCHFFSVPIVAVLAALAAQPAAAQVPLADRPLLTPDIPGNLVMALSVEFPTGVSVAHSGTYDPTLAAGYLGYFDRSKCYSYVFYATETATQVSHFYPDGLAAANNNCSGQTGRWSGNFLNWATTQTIDPFRWALTGGKRLVDTTDGLTILEKARASGQGGRNNFPTRTTTGNAVVNGATPFNWPRFRGRVEGLGYALRFSDSARTDADADSNLDGTVSNFNPATGAVAGGQYQVYIRVRVCNPSAPGGVETNCKLYGSNYKPEGLVQQYADRIRYSTFGYLNDGNLQRDGGVLRARQKFVAPLAPRPGLPAESNALREWDATTGVMVRNPDPNDATNFGNVADSGVMNYLNKFGRNDYKGFDPVGELYYAAVRYLKNQGNVSEWSNDSNTGNRNDGFPVISTWDDPIQYSCQSNFILGIGDVNTHADRNVPGATNRFDEPAMPTAVSNDATVNVQTQTNAVGVLEGMGSSIGTITNFNGCCSNNSALMAGLAYDSHIRDIRPTLTGIQTIKTLWVDVLEPDNSRPNYRVNNQYYLAAKYGGFRVPTTFNYQAADLNAQTATALADLNNWNRNGQTLSEVTVATASSALRPGTIVSNRTTWPNTTGDNRRPDSYYTAGDPQSMVDGLREAFSSIATDLTAASTSFALVSPRVVTTNNGNISYGAQYTSANWTGRLAARYLNFDSAGVPTAAANELWSTDTTFRDQLAGTGWDVGRSVVTFRPDTRAGATFRSASLSAAQLTALDTPYVAGDDSGAYLNYLRGSRTNEGTSATNYRARVGLLGDIAGSRVTAVDDPISRYSDAANPGYAAFVTAQTGRQRMVYVGANDGMLHAFNGEALTADGGGREVFAYVPSALFNGSTLPATSITQATRATDALTSRGNPFFEHKPLVDATAEVFDIDFARTGGPITGTPTPDWRSVLIGGLGKGGRSYYAINVTSPQTVSGEAGWAGRVLWEFPNANVTSHASAVSQMGFSFGKPLVTKTAKWGWVVILPSGYNSVNGGSFLFFLNPSTGALLETVAVGRSPTSVATATPVSSGLAHVQGYRRDFADNTAESVYAADLEGNVWRVDVRSSTATYAATRIADLNLGNVDQPVTTRLLVEIDPASGRRYVLVGTGRLLDTTDIASPARQTFYAIIDGTRSLFDTGTAVVTRDNLVENTSATLTGTTGVTPTADRSRGWYLELGPTGNTGAAWRMVLDPVTNAGRVAFATLLPNTGDPCNQGTGRVYAIDIGRGQTAFENSAAFVETSSPVISLGYTCIGAQCNLIIGRQTGTTGGVAENSIEDGGLRPPTPVPLRRLNWRELQIVQ